MRLILLFLLLATAGPAAWYKGNTHAHTLNSDGNATPDVVAKWYREHGYNFLFITDHEYLTDVAPLNALYGREGQFLLITGQEVSQHLGHTRNPADPTDRPGAHVNALNASKPVIPLGGTYGRMTGIAPPEMSMAELYERNIREIVAAGGVAQVNHPNWKWSVREEDLRGLPDNTLFEIWNGQLGINNLGGGDDDGNVAPSAETLWDKLLSQGKKIWGVADDDSHNYYHLDEEKGSNPGQAWIVVRAEKLTAADITAALGKGDFYASTGIVLDDVTAGDQEVSLKIRSVARGPRYRTRFIGKDGRVLAEVTGTKPHYTIKGDEGYVRASVIDSNGLKAWTQPVFVRAKTP